MTTNQAIIEVFNASERYIECCGVAADLLVRSRYDARLIHEYDVVRRAKLKAYDDMMTYSRILNDNNQEEFVGRLWSRTLKAANVAEQQGAVFAEQNERITA